MHSLLIGTSSPINMLFSILNEGAPCTYKRTEYCYCWYFSEILSNRFYHACASYFARHIADQFNDISLLTSGSIISIFWNTGTLILSVFYDNKFRLKLFSLFWKVRSVIFHVMYNNVLLTLIYTREIILSNSEMEKRNFQL